LSVSQAEVEGIRLSASILRGFTFKYDHEFGYFRTRRSYSWKVPKRHDSTYAPIFLCLGVRSQCYQAEFLPICIPSFSGYLPFSRGSSLAMHVELSITRPSRRRLHGRDPWVFYSNQPRNRDIRSLCRNRVHPPTSILGLRKSPIVNSRQHAIHHKPECTRARLRLNLHGFRERGLPTLPFVAILSRTC
jgi:hypothetical protein